MPAALAWVSNTSFDVPLSKVQESKRMWLQLYLFLFVEPIWLWNRCSQARLRWLRLVHASEIANVAEARRQTHAMNQCTVKSVNPQNWTAAKKTTNETKRASTANDKKTRRKYIAVLAKVTSSSVVNSCRCIRLMLNKRQGASARMKSKNDL